MIRSYIALDLETTGLSPKEDRIIEVAAVRVENGVAQDQYTTLVNPGIMLETRITELTGITDEMVRNAPAIEDILKEVLAFCGGLPLLGHNIAFDYSFLKQAAINQGLPFEAEAADTLKLCRQYMPETERKNLGAACEFYGVSLTGAHRALADAMGAHLLYEKLFALYGEGHEDRFMAVPLHYNAKRVQPATKRQKEYLQDLIKYHRIDVTVQMEYLSRSEASRMIDRIILNYGRLYSSHKKDG